MNGIYGPAVDTAVGTPVGIGGGAVGTGVTQPLDGQGVGLLEVGTGVGTGGVMHSVGGQSVGAGLGVGGTTEVVTGVGVALHAIQGIGPMEWPATCAARNHTPSSIPTDITIAII